MLHAVKEGLLSYCENVYSRGNINQKHGFGGVMVGVLASSAVDRGFELRFGQTKDYKIGSEWLLFNANSAIFQLHYGENKLTINEMMIRFALF
jgi:hypothetical protein